MRCADCETEPLNLARYCECCGCEMSLHEAQAEEPSLFSDADPSPSSEEAEEPSSVSGEADEVDASGADDWAPNPNPTSDLRYQSCIGPSLDGDSSQPNYEPSAITYTDPATPQGNDVTASADTQPAEDSVSSASIASTASSQDAPGHAIVASGGTPQALTEATTTSVKEKVAVAKALETDVVKTRETLPKRAKVDAIETERVRRSADVVRRPNIPVAPQRRYQPIALVAAVVFAAIGIGAPWIRFHNVPGLGRLEQLAMSFAKQAKTEVADVQDRAAFPIEGPADPRTAIQDRSAALPEERPAAPTPVASPRERPATPTTATQDRKSSTTVAPEASTPLRRKPTTTPVASPRRAPVPAAAKPVRVKDSTREVPAAPVLASAPVIAPAVVDVVAAAPTPAPAAPSAAVGPFFETRDVSESPRIATRAEPRLPTGLKDRAVKEMVVVRALVSQSGHPSRVSLLRRSKSGPELDDVVVAAVNHWTFDPAKKKGEPVSCWFNFAVQVGGTD